MSGLKLSVVVPVYLCAESIEPLYARGSAAFAAAGIDATWIFVDDHSPDESWVILCALAKREPNVAALRLERNIGQHGAIWAGITHAEGPWTAVIDGDLEDRPEDIPRLLACAREGHDVVMAAVSQGPRSFVRRAGSALYRGIVGLRAPGTRRLATFTVMSERGRASYLSSPRATDAYLVCLLRLGVPLGVVPVDRDRRATGRSSYSLARLAKVATRGSILFAPWVVTGLVTAFWLLSGVVLALLLPGLGPLLALAGLGVSLAALGIARLVALAGSRARRSVGVAARCGTLAGLDSNPPVRTVAAEESERRHP